MVAKPRNRDVTIYFIDSPTPNKEGLTHSLHTVQEVTSAMGEPDLKRPNGMVSTTPERDGNPEITLTYPTMIYTKLSGVADVHVLIYPNDRVAISFQGKEIEATQGLSAIRWYPHGIPPRIPMVPNQSHYPRRGSDAV